MQDLETLVFVGFMIVALSESHPIIILQISMFVRCFI